MLEGIDGILELLPGVGEPVHLAQAVGVATMEFVQQLFRIATLLGQLNVGQAEPERRTRRSLRRVFPPLFSAAENRDTTKLLV